MLFEASTKVYAAFFLFLKDDLVLTMRRGEYRGLPGGIVPQDRPYDLYAKEIVLGLARVREFGQCQFVTRQDGEWEKLPASIGIFEFPNARIDCLHDVCGAEFVDIIEDNPVFDITIKAIQEILREKRSALRSVV